MLDFTRDRQLLYQQQDSVQKVHGMVLFIHFEDPRNNNFLYLSDNSDGVDLFRCRFGLKIDFLQLLHSFQRVFRLL